MKSFVFATVYVAVVTLAACGGNVVVDTATTTTGPATGGTTTTSPAATGPGGAGGFGAGGFGAGGFGGGFGGSITTDATTASSVSSNVSSSSGFGGCDGICEAMFPMAYQRFLLYEVKECACVPGSPCSGSCTMLDCAMMTSQVSPGCQACLTNQENMGINSSCTVKAATQDCMGDATCAPFGKCGVCCATQNQPC